MSSGLAEADQVPVLPSLAGLVGGHDSVGEENVKEAMECPVIDEISLKFKPANTVRSVLTLYRHIYDKTEESNDLAAQTIPQPMLRPLRDYPQPSKSI